jgi:hypothetical protein
MLGVCVGWVIGVVRLPISLRRPISSVVVSVVGTRDTICRVVYEVANVVVATMVMALATGMAVPLGVIGIRNCISFGTHKSAVELATTWAFVLAVVVAITQTVDLPVGLAAFLS